MTDVRPCAVAGSWYPGTAARLAEDVDACLAAVPVSEEGCPIALMAPHAGLPYSGPVAAFAYQRVRRCGYAAVVLVGPSHFVAFPGVAIWPRGRWATPLGPVAVAETLAAAITARNPEVREYPAAHSREHSLEMQLPFVARVLPGVPIVPMVMGHQTRATAFALGRTLAETLEEWPGPVLLVASSDLSHYHEAHAAQALDAVVLRHVQALDSEGLMDALEREPGHACGGGPIVAVLHAARQRGATRGQVLRYADSGDVSGDKTAVVGYMAGAVW